MAIQKVDSQQLPLTPAQSDEILLKINNGDLEALNALKSKWKFKSVEDILRFALAILVKSDNLSINITSEGKQVTFTPASSLLITDENK